MSAQDCQMSVQMSSAKLTGVALAEAVCPKCQAVVFYGS
jgi:hypothetical protein